MKVTISGSLRKHFEEISVYRNYFIELGHLVLSPVEGNIVGEEDGFVILENDSGTYKHIEAKHLNAIANSDILYVASKDGYIGPSTAMEIGYANALSIPIYTNCKPSERVFCDLIIIEKPQNIYLVEDNNSRIIEDPEVSLNVLQKELFLQAIRLGFDKETTQELILMAVEEIGEIAAIERRRSGIVAANERKSDFQNEIADLLIYALSISNNEGISAQKSIIDKMTINEKRFKKLINSGK